MKQPKSLRCTILSVAYLAVQLPTAHAAIVGSGDVLPADPSLWEAYTAAYVGKTAEGDLEVNDGSDLLSREARIGDARTATGVVTIDGAGSTWVNGRELYVGSGGNGTLNVFRGAAVSNSYGYIGYGSDSTSVVVIDGDGSTWNNSERLYVGYWGSGTLNIFGGAAVSNDYAYIGYDTNSTGVVTVGGTGSTWTNNGRLYVGHEASGTLSISEGAAVSNSYGYIGYDTDSTGAVTVAGTGTTWTNSIHLYVGDQGDATLNISEGATVSNKYGYIGYDTNSTGEVTIDGAGSTWSNTGSLHVGSKGSGTLNISGGAAVSVSGSTNVAYEPGSTGSIHFGPGGGTLTTYWLSAAPAELRGVGTINTRGLLSDVDLTFDSVASLNQDVILDSLPDQDITVHLDMATSPTTNGSLGVGWKGRGSLTIRDGVRVSCYRGYIGYYSDSTGTVAVTGAGSEWTSRDSLSVGRAGAGTLNITGGAAVSTGDAARNGAFVPIGDLTGSTGAVTVDGPDSTWTHNGGVAVGRYGHGTLNITGGAAVSNGHGKIGSQAESIGVVTVDGAGSTWTNDLDLTVGYFGSGRLNISGGAEVSAAGHSTFVAHQPGSTGLIDFGTGGGTLTTGSLLASVTDLTGSGTINTGSLVSDVDLVFDSPASLAQTLVLDGQSGQNVVVNLDMASDPSSNGALGAGWKGRGSLTIRDGVSINSDIGYIGFHADSRGAVTVDGAGSTWTNRTNLIVGCYGNGALTITGGAVVTNSSWCFIGHVADSTGVVTVDGGGSTFTIGDALTVGGNGNGTLNITGGAAASSSSAEIGDTYRSTGVVTVDGTGSTWTNSNDLRLDKGSLYITGGAVVSTTSVSSYNDALLVVDVGNGSLLDIDGGNGEISNRGKIRLLAGAGVPAGSVYEPIAATTWEFDSKYKYQPVGGTWDVASHRFTVSGVESGMSQSALSIDRAQTQRLFIDDTETGWSLGVSFLAAEAASEVTLTAATVDGSTLDELEALLRPSDVVRGAWVLESTGAYTAGNPMYLSFHVGPDFDRSDLTLWHYENAEWSEYFAADLTCNEDYASFTATNMASYAVSAIPEPSTLILLSTGVAGLLVWGWRRRR